MDCPLPEVRNEARLHPPDLEPLSEPRSLQSHQEAEIYEGDAYLNQVGLDRPRHIDLGVIAKDKAERLDPKDPLVVSRALRRQP